MASNIQPIKSTYFQNAFSGKGGPNPPKVAIVLAELQVPHEFVHTPLSKVKEPEYLAINPNGRIPAIYDPNTDLTLWESGAIIEYLTERYDEENRISFPQGTNESYHTRQWLYYQVSGQGPYYGQASWFKKFHPEKVPSALERYVKEVNRVSGVLEGYLLKQEEQYGNKNGGPWLVGDKYTFADIAFAPWQTIVEIVVKPEDGYSLDDYPTVKEWVARVKSRDAVSKVFEDIQPVL